MTILSFTAGNDIYTVASADDYTLSFLAGADKLTIASADAHVIADMGEGADVVNVNSGSVDISGGAGNDRITFFGPSTGALVHGGDGNDIILSLIHI